MAVTITQTGTGNGTSNTSSATINGVAAGALLVFSTTAADDNSAVTVPAVTSSPSLQWFKKVNASAVSSGSCAIYVALFPAGGNITVTGNWGAGSGSFLSTSSLYEIAGGDTGVRGINAVAFAQTAPSLVINTTAANSLLIMVAADWTAADGASRTYRDSATEVLYFRTATVSTGYHFYKLTTTQGAYTEGISAPTGQTSGMCILEIIPAFSNAASSGYNQIRNLRGFAFRGKRTSSPGMTLLHSRVQWADKDKAEESIFKAWAFEAGGPTTYNISYTETSTAGDGVTTIMTMLNALTESATAGDSLANNMVMPAALTENATSGSSLANSMVMPNAITESATAGDSLATVMTMLNSITESATATDVVTTIMTMFNSITESATAGDSATGGSIYSATLTESATAGDSVVAVVIMNPTLTESVTAGDTVAAIMTMQSLINESATAGDNLSTSMIMTAVLTSAATAGDAVSAQLNISTVLTETVSTTDAMTALMIMSASLTEVATAGDGVVAVVVSASGGLKFYVNISGVWKLASPFIKVAGVWKPASSYIKVGGTWKNN